MNKHNESIRLTDCQEYIEDSFICDDIGEPKGQCAKCGYKWYAHKIENLPEKEKESALEIQTRLGITNK